jgi:hypothetical protein
MALAYEAMHKSTFLRLSIGSSAIFDQEGMNSRGRHDRCRCREIKFRSDEIMEPPILVYDLVLPISSILLQN